MRVFPQINGWVQSLNKPFFLVAFRNGGPCDPDLRDSDLSIHPADYGLKLCYRVVWVEKVYFVLKDVDWMELRDDRLPIF